MIADEIKRTWLKSYDDEVRPNLDYEKIPIYEYLDRSAQKYPQRPAIIFNNWKINYAKLKKLAERVAANLRAHGLKPGNRVAIMLPNTPQCIISYWGVLKAGGVVVMTNPLYMEKELVHHFNDSEARFLITIDMLWPKINKLFSKLGVQKVFITRISDCLRFPLNFLYNFKVKREGKAPEIPFDKEKILSYNSAHLKQICFLFSVTR